MKKIISKIFTDHPNSVGETYFEHMGQALYFAGNLLLGFFYCLCHAFIPAAFKKSGSKLITKLYDRMVANRNRHHKETEQTKKAA